MMSVIKCNQVVQCGYFGLCVALLPLVIPAKLFFRHQGLAVPYVVRCQVPLLVLLLHQEHDRGAATVGHQSQV